MSRGRKRKNKKERSKRSPKHSKKNGMTNGNSRTDLDQTSSNPADTGAIVQRPGLILNLNYGPSVIGEKTRLIYDLLLERSEFIDKGNFTSIGVSDLQLMFELYDEIFFKDFFKKNFPDLIHFRLSKRMTRVGGKTERYRDPKYYVIKLSSALLFQTFNDEDRDVMVNGIICNDRLEAAMRIFEHELIHLIEMVMFGDSSCKQPRFIYYCIRFFGHMGVKHQLVTGYEIVKRDHNLKVGDTVSFEFKGGSFEGKISRITKRATVMVSDPKGQFTDLSGKSYTKFYIPLNRLEPVNHDQTGCEELTGKNIDGTS